MRINNELDVTLTGRSIAAGKIIKEHHMYTATLSSLVTDAVADHSFHSIIITTSDSSSSAKYKVIALDESVQRIQN